MERGCVRRKRDFRMYPRHERAMSDDAQRLDDAIAWHVRLNSGDANEATWARFTAWLEADEANLAAYDRVEDLDAQIDSAIVVEPAPIEFRRTSRGRRLGWAAAATLLAASLLIGIATRTSQPSTVQYATPVGETKTVTLADRSTVTLNTDTRIDVALHGGTRGVTLLHGEALFHVAKDTTHPFIVTAGDRAVRVVGTVFDVLRDAGVVTVVVAEGNVAVSQRAAGEKSTEIHLTSGQRAIGREGSTHEIVEHVNSARALAWREGYLIYDNTPLSSVVNDLNRYFAIHIALADSGVAIRRFSGVLRIDNESAVLARIAQFLHLRAERTDDGIVLREAPMPD